MLTQLRVLFGQSPFDLAALENVRKASMTGLFAQDEDSLLCELADAAVDIWKLPGPDLWRPAWQKFCRQYLKSKTYPKGRLDDNSFGQGDYPKDVDAVYDLLMELYYIYREPFFVNTNYFCTLFYADGVTSIDNLTWCMSAAAETDLTPVFARHGMQVTLPSLPIAGEPFHALLKEKESGFLPYHRPKVLIDQTHSYQFVVYHLAYFLHEHDFLGTHSDRSLRASLYKNLDVVVTHQEVVAVPYSDEEISELVSFVEKGGGLLMIGNYPELLKFRAYAALNAEGIFPLNKLAEKFGLRFSDQIADPIILIEEAERIENRPFQFEMPGMSCLVVPDSATVILRDRAGQPIFARLRFGKGHVAAIGGTAFIKWLDVLPLNQLFLQHFYQLGAESPNLHLFKAHHTDLLFSGVEMHQGWDYELDERPHLQRRYRRRADFIWPENSKSVGRLQVLYAHAMSAYVDKIIDTIYQEVYDTLAAFYRCPPESDSAERLHFYPHWGSGYTWMPPHVREGMIGIPCLGNDDDRVKHIFAHELTHAWGLPGPPGWEHCWTQFTDHYFMEKLHCYSPEKRHQLWQNLLEDLKKKDPDLNLIDISIRRVDNVAEEHLRWTKFAYMFDLLCRRYGYDLLSRYIRLVREAGIIDKEALSLEDFIRYLSLAANEDLYPFFIRHGTTVPVGDISSKK